jgi:hypothetical protein
MAARTPGTQLPSLGRQVHMLRVWNQAKQAAHFGPPISISFPEELGIQMHRPLARKQPRDPR